MVTRKKRTRRRHPRRRRRSTHHKKRFAGLPSSRSSRSSNNSRERYFRKTKKILKGNLELDKRTRRKMRSKINKLYKPPQGIRSAIIGRPLNRQGRELLGLLNNKEREMRSDEKSL
jgi:hypothetical protein